MVFYTPPSTNWNKNDRESATTNATSHPADGAVTQQAADAGDEPGIGFAAEYEEPATYHSPAPHAMQSEDSAANHAFGSSIYGNGSTTFGSQATAPTRPESQSQGRDNTKNDKDEPRQPREPGSIVFINTNPLETPSQAKNKEETNRGDCNTATRQEKESAKTFAVAAAAGKKITNIVVFYSDNSFQSFSPTE